MKFRYLPMLCAIGLFSVLVVSWPFNLAFGQQNLYEHPPEFIRENGIKRIVELRNTLYHQEMGLPPDSSRVYEFDRNGLMTYSTGFLDNRRSYWTIYTYDDQQRLLKSERFNGEEVHDAAEYEYLPNGDYRVRFFHIDNPENRSAYRYFLDENGNEIERQELQNDSLVLRRTLKTYTDLGLIKSSVHLGFLGDTIVQERYFYKQDTLLVKKEFFNKRALSMRTKYEYNMNGKEKAVHFGDQSSWYSSYDEHGRLIRQEIVRYDQKDTVYNVYAYNNRGLIELYTNDRKNSVNRREVYTYEDGKEKTKELYKRANTFNSLMEMEYLGDSVKLTYTIPHWEKRRTWLEYQRTDKYGNVIEVFRSELKGFNKSIQKLKCEAEIDRFSYRMSASGKVLAKYKVVKGWTAESAFCDVYGLDELTNDFHRQPRAQKYYTCDTIKVKKHEGGKQYVVEINGKPNIRRHIYQNKTREIDSVLDINRAGTVLNRMVRENGVPVTYFLRERFEYNDMDSLEYVFNVHGSLNYTTGENRVEEHVWEKGRKVKIERFQNHWGQYSSKDKTTITLEYSGRDVLRTTTSSQGEITEERYRYDETGRLIEIMNLDRLGNGHIRTKFTYDEDGSLLERSEEAIMNPIELMLEYEFY